LYESIKEHKKDYSSRRGLIKKVTLRRKLLRYLEKENEKSFDDIVKKLKIKITKKQNLDEELFEEKLEEEENLEEPVEEKI